MIKNIKSFQNYFQKKEAWNSFLRGPKTGDASRDALRGQGYSLSGTDNLHGKNPTNWVEFGGRKFYNQDLPFAQYNNMSEIPRIEGDKLIIANLAWIE